jgi:DNA-binding NtrC family response regulator
MKHSHGHILIADDDQDICMLLSLLMKGEGFTCHIAHDGETVLRMVQTRMPDALLLDIKMPGMDGMEVLQEIQKLDHDLPVILITGHPDISGSVAAIKNGAFDYLAKPFDHRSLVRVVRRALEQRERQHRGCSQQVSADDDLRIMMGPSDVISRVIGEVNRVAQSNFSVVIQGETGAGKELVARAIHQRSTRSRGPFIPVDCGAIPETLIESELFGCQKGAFTGAEVPRMGKIEAAKGGTLFLDEISNLPLAAQPKLLRALQDKTICRLGATNPLPIDVRLLAATNQDLYSLVVAGLMRQDLYFRLNEFSITVPPLRERKEDIPYLAKRFLDITNRELKKNIKSFSAAALEVLFSYNWPGNVRQLRSTIRRAVLLAEEVITDKQLDIKRVPVPGLAFTPKVQGMPWQEMPLKEIVRRSVDSVEREVLIEALKFTRGNKAKAARLLHIDYKTIHTKVKQFGIGKYGGNHDQTEG